MGVVIQIVRSGQRFLDKKKKYTIQSTLIYIFMEEQSSNEYEHML